MKRKWPIWQKREQEIIASDGRRMLAEQQDLRVCEQKQVTGYEPNQNRSLAVSTRNGHATTSAVIGGEVGLVLTDHPTHQTSSFFPSCTGFEISGGHFIDNTSRDHHSTGNVFINVTQSSKDGSVEVDRSAHGSRWNRQCNGPSEQHGREILEPQSPVVAQNPPSPTISRATGHSPSCPPGLTVQKSSEIYYRHLLTSGRGSPLWIPDPSSTLSLEYQREGIGVGDVIILTDSGGTDFMFNVYHPKQDSAHPISPPEMPEGYYPLERPRSSHMTCHMEFKNNSFLTSAFVNSRRDEEFSGLIFESSAMDGAILTMPNGARSTDLQNKTTIRKYARNNAVQWYKYANEVCGRDVRNGDLRLVVGKTSTTTWGMATFAECTHSESAFSLKFKPSGNSAGGTSPATYGWEYSFAGMATTKSGPDSHEIERLRDNDVDGGDSDHLKVYENQCLFVRTINVMLQDDVWDKLLSEWKTLGLVEDEGPPSGPNSGFGLGSAGSDISSGASGSQSSSGLSGMSSVGNQLGTQATQAGMDGKSRGMSFTPTPQGTRQRSSVHLSPFPPPLGLHPSNIINQFLLRERPQAKIAITEDEDWISVLDKNDKYFPEPDILISRVMTKYKFNDETNVVFLKLRDIPDVPTISHPSVISPSKPPGIVSEGRDVDRHQVQQHFGHTSEARLESRDSYEPEPSIQTPIMSRSPLPRPSYSRLSSSPSPDHMITCPIPMHTPLDSAIKLYKSVKSRKPVATSQQQLLEMTREPGNNICADCKARAPRWASYNLGIFICVNCASIHRKMGTHVTKVKSLTMDDWTKDQIKFMESVGNNKSNAIYNPNELRNPPPPDIENHECDDEMEQYLRSKYEYKRFMDKSALVASNLGTPQLAALVTPTSTPWPSPATNKHLPSTNAWPPATASEPTFSFPSSLPSTLKNPTTPRQPWYIPPNNPSSGLTVQQQKEVNSRNDIQSMLADLDEMIGPDKSSYKPSQPHVNGAIGAQGYPVGVTAAGTGMNPFAQQELSINPYSQQASQSPFAPAPYIPQTTQPSLLANSQSYASTQSFSLPSQMSSMASGFSQPISLPQLSMQTQSSSFTPTSNTQRFYSSSASNPSQFLSAGSSNPQFLPSSSSSPFLSSSSSSPFLSSSSSSPFLLSSSSSPFLSSSPNTQPFLSSSPNTQFLTPSTSQRFGPSQIPQTQIQMQQHPTSQIGFHHQNPMSQQPAGQFGGSNIPVHSGPSQFMGMTTMQMQQQLLLQQQEQQRQEQMQQERQRQQMQMQTQLLQQQQQQQQQMHMHMQQPLQQQQFAQQGMFGPGQSSEQQPPYSQMFPQGGGGFPGGQQQWGGPPRGI